MMPRWIGRIRGWRNVGSGAPYLAAPTGPEREKPDTMPSWRAAPFAAEPTAVADAIWHGGWTGAGLRRYQSLADARITCTRALGENLVLYELAPAGAPIGAYAELVELATALIRYDRQHVDDGAWERAA